jgi:cytochrome c551/c552
MTQKKNKEKVRSSYQIVAAKYADKIEKRTNHIPNLVWLN